MSRTRLSTWVGLGRKTLIGLCLLTLAACATQGSSFKASGLNDHNCFQMYEIGAIDGERREKCETGL